MRLGGLALMGLCLLNPGATNQVFGRGRAKFPALGTLEKWVRRRIGLHHYDLAAYSGSMSQTPPRPASSADLRCSAFFKDQIEKDEKQFALMRISAVHRSRMAAHGRDGEVKLRLPHQTNTASFAVGDWVLVEQDTRMLVRLLDRHTLLQRHTVGAKTPQLIAANVDTLFIVTSCNDDFNDARLERYLALANEAGTTPVIVLTKSDLVGDTSAFRNQAEQLQRALPVVAVNAKSSDTISALAQWCGPEQTVALIGSSGVGKSTLLNTLASKSAETAQATGGIREVDAKGRHTTTSRSLHTTSGGGWLIDTPGMRTLHVSDIATGLDILFAEITELAPQCRFRDCTHSREPGCAVQQEIAAGNLDPARLERWRKLVEENRENTPSERGSRGRR